MSNLIIISIVLLKFGVILANYLHAESNYLKPKLERNNVVNKGVWMRNKANFFEKAHTGDFIFRPNSVDVDNVLQNNFDAFGENYMQDTPFLSSYIERSKRSPNHIRKRRPRKSLKNCTNKSNCKKSTANSLEDKSTLVQSKLISDLKPTSVFNDYPYEVAILLNSQNIVVNDSTTADKEENRLQFNVLDTSKPDKTNIAEHDVKTNVNDTNNGTYALKRSSKYDYEGETIKKFEIIENINKTDENVARNKIDRGIFDKDDRVWHQNAALPDINVYKVVPKAPEKIKPVTERGLIKVISMLTKTFKKIIKQHNEIKSIHGNLSNLNDDFLKNVALVTRKFENFDEKYLYLTKLQEQFETFEANLAVKEEYFKNKQREMAKNFVEFEKQQKKFLNQQKQFYAIQKLMLSQNEKMNLKQNLISKTQSEISHRQNNFARILKKAKQLYIDSRNPAAKLNSNLGKIKNTTEDTYSKQVTHTTTSNPATETVKINLFSIPTSNRIENQDEGLMKEKDEQQIDDLVYKYYFNNTFIDNIMRNKILTSNVATAESRDVRNSAKNKRNELNSTILLPVDKANITEYVKTKRDRRWISHHSRRNTKGKTRGEDFNLNANSSDIKAAVEDHVRSNKSKDKKSDPFMTMATNFCNEIGQNANRQILGWCVEKALRRLQYKDMKHFSGPIVRAGRIDKSNKMMETKQQTTESNSNNTANETSSPVTGSRAPLILEKLMEGPSGLNVIKQKGPQAEEASSIAPSTAIPKTMDLNQNEAMSAIPTGGIQNNIFFPDNDELESNLKQYDTNPDREGNVYYDGSVHTSDMMLGDSDGDGGFSDIMPGLDSNSRVDLDPMAFDLQSRRRAYVKSINADILKKMFRLQG